MYAGAVSNLKGFRDIYDMSNVNLKAVPVVPSICNNYVYNLKIS